jgi:Tol biopolymer transport system component
MVRWLASGAAVALAGMVAYAATGTPTPRAVTNTSGGQNQNPSIDKSGKLIVFTSSSPASVMFGAAGTFDFNGSGNDFVVPGNTPPTPNCANCSNADGNGELFLWRLKAKGTDPANSIRQITFSTGGGLAANENAAMNQNGTVVAWDSDRDYGSNAGNDREIFIQDLATNTITQLTSTTGGGGAANRNVDISDDGKTLVWDSNRDYAGVLGCTLVDGTTPCDNSDNNSEIMLLDLTLNKLTQITNTTGGGTSANIRPRISDEAKFLAFQSTRDFASVTNCTLTDGTSACTNSDNNGEIMYYDRVLNKFTQVTNTAASGSCSGTTPNERVEISKGGKFVTFQSTCEFQLNPTGCGGSCDGSDNDEVFLYDASKKTLTQVTISVTGRFNRVPRISGAGNYIIFESNASYKNLNPSHARVLYIIKRNSKAGSGGFTGPGQLIADDETGAIESSKSQVVIVNRAGGFNSSTEGFAAAIGGKYYAFDNSKGVGNSEIFFLDRTK